MSGPVPAIGEGDVREIRVPVPPLDEQQRLVAKERLDTAALDKALGLGQREIDLIRQYRTRLIADVVTGKLDVRGLASAPDDETTAADELDVDIDEEEMPEDEESELVEEMVDADE